MRSKIIGISMDERMTKELVIKALADAMNHSGDVRGCILHSDRGSQYCSRDYANKAKAAGFIMSMSRKGNCWDNAPMESFWGKLKQEWLNEQHFKTRAEAKAAIYPLGFDCSADNISLHLKNIFNEDELEEDATTEIFSVVQKEGIRDVTRKVKCYNFRV